jgi:hypothetical protein
MKLDLQVSEVFGWNYDALNNADIRFIINQGGSRCFAPNTLIQTDKGNKQISQIEVGDIVKSFNEDTKEIEYKKVLSTFENVENKKKAIRIKLKNGSIIEATEDHKFYFEGGFTSLKHIVSLLEKK